MSLARSISPWGCTRHGRYPSKAFAKKRARQVAATNGGRPLDAFRCPHCGYWHVGHPARAAS